MEHLAEDLETCWSCHERKPEFRISKLEGEGKLAGGDPTEAGVILTFMCKPCAADSIRADADELVGALQSDIPLHGLALLPMVMTGDQVCDLIEEMGRNVSVRES